MADQEVTLRIKGDGSSAKAMLADLDKDVKGSATGIAASSEKSADALLKVGVAITAFGAGITLALNKAADTAAAYGAEVVNVQRLTGLAATESSQWAYIMQRLGLDSKQVALVIKSLSSAIVGQSDDLKTMGIATQDANGKNREALTVLGDLAEWYSKTTDKTLANAGAAKVLGRNYQSLLPLLAGGRAGIEKLTAAASEFGMVLTQDNINTVKEYSKALKDNKDAVTGLAVQTGVMLLPLKTELNKKLLELLQTVNQLDPATKKLAVGTIAVGAGIADLAGPLATGVALFPDFLKGLAALKLAGAGAATILGDMGAGISLYGGAVLGSGVGATAAFVGGLGALAIAGARLIQPGGWIDQWIAKDQEARATTVQLTDAQRNLIPVGQAVIGIHNGMTQAEAGYADATSRAASFVTTHTERTAALGAMLQRTPSATAAAAGGVSAWAAVVDDGTAALDAHVDAVNRLNSTLDLTDSAESQMLVKKLAVKQAEQDLTEARKKGAAGADEARLAELRLKDAKGQLTAAGRLLLDQSNAEARGWANNSEAEIKAAVKSGVLTVAQGKLASAAHAAAVKAAAVAAALNGIPPSKTVTVTIKVNGMSALAAANRAIAHTGGRQYVVGAASGGIVPGGFGTLRNVAENGYNETMLNWAPSNYDSNLAMIATTLKGIGVPTSVAVGGGITVAPGAVQINMPPGVTPAQATDAGYAAAHAFVAEVALEIGRL